MPKFTGQVKIQTGQKRTMGIVQIDLEKTATPMERDVFIMYQVTAVRLKFMTAFGIYLFYCIHTLV